MDYPTLFRKELTKEQKETFDFIKDLVYLSIDLDNEKDEMDLSDNDIEVLSWNITADLISQNVQI